MRRIVVITGASAGVGRATARAFAEHGFDVALLARGTAGLEGGGRGESGRRAVPGDPRRRRPTSRRSTRPPLAGRDRTGADRRVGQRRDDHRVRSRLGRETGRLPTGRRGDVPRPGVGHDGRAGADAAPRPRLHRQRRLGARLHRHPACSPRTARRSSPAAGSSSRPEPSCSTRAATSGCPWCICRRSTPRSSTGARRRWTITRSRSRPSTSPRSPLNSSSQVALDGRPIQGRRLVEQDAGRCRTGCPGLGNHYAALGAWDTQLTDQTIRPDRPDNLYQAGRRRPRRGRPRHLRRQGRRLPRPQLPQDAPRHRPHVHHRLGGDRQGETPHLLGHRPGQSRPCKAVRR